ncbi:hypothetical protein ACHQM5_006013 [Ranunculus cassubicifolius]
MVTMAELCQSYDNSCSGSSIQPIISFPFSDYGPCAYPGFSISCNESSKAVIQLGSWGEFFVRNVNYISQEVEIYDQRNCLPRRLLNLDLSGTPFRGAQYENFTFYNCSSEFSSNVSKPITCLSTPNHTIYANSNATVMKNFSTCYVIASVMVPSKPRYRTDINRNVFLVWDTPDCKACVGELYGQCDFKNKERLELKCVVYLPPKQGFPKSAKFAVILGITVPILVCFILITWCLVERYQNFNGNNSHRVEHVGAASPIITTAGLDDSVIQSYPKTEIGESLRLANPDDNTCSICLSEYQPKEILRTIPECQHCFHATCIDEWLHQNVTCPICRNASSPLPIPA